MRDFHDELKIINEVRDPLFKVEQCKMWIENYPAATKPLQGDQLAAADQTIQHLQQNQAKIQFEADALTLARDATQIASLLAEDVQSERAKRLQRVLHLRQENALGATIVQKHMATHCYHGSGPVSLITPYMEKAWGTTWKNIIYDMQFMANYGRQKEF